MSDKDSPTKQPLENEERTETKINEQRNVTGYASDEHFAEKQEEVDSLNTELANVNKESLRQAEIDKLTSDLKDAYSDIFRLQGEGMKLHEIIAKNPDKNLLKKLLQKIEALEGVKKIQAEEIKKLKQQLHEYEQSLNVVLQSRNLAIMEELDSSPQLKDQFERLNIEGGEDNEDGTNRAQGSDNFKQENSSKIPQFRKEYYCPVACVSMVLSLIFDLMKLSVCNRRLNKKVQNELCLLSMINNEDFKIGNCSLAFEEFHSVGLIEKEPKFFKKIENAEDGGDSLKHAIATMEQESDPALFRMHYKEKQGTKRAGHCVAIMPDGKFIDVRKKDYWEPEKDPLWKHVNLIEVWKVKKNIAEEWEKECSLKICVAECRHNIHHA